MDGAAATPNVHTAPTGGALIINARMYMADVVTRGCMAVSVIAGDTITVITRLLIIIQFTMAGLTIRGPLLLLTDGAGAERRGMATMARISSPIPFIHTPR